MKAQPAGRIGLSVIGGFLGAGKTTLLNRLIAGNRGRSVAYLVNDFGAVNIDAALVASRSATTIELTNGCVCCSIGDDLTAALLALLESAQPPEAIVIEASGVSDPWRIAQVGLADPALQLEGVTVLVDASAFARHCADPLLADSLLRQLGGADLIVVNKCDLATPGELAALHAQLDARVPRTPRVQARDADVPLALLGLGEVERVLDCGCGHGHCAHGNAQHHEALFETWSGRITATCRADGLRALLKNMPEGVLRLKGLVSTDQHGPTVLQFAGRHGSLRAAPNPAPGPAAGFVVAIGLRGRLPVAALEQALAAVHLRDREPVDVFA